MPVLSKQMLYIIPHMLIFSGLMQKTFFLVRRFIEKETPKERQVGRAGGTLIVIKSNAFLIISSVDIMPFELLYINFGSAMKNCIKATSNRIDKNLMESFLKDI